MTAMTAEPDVPIVAIGTLRPAPWNPRTITDRAFKTLVRSLRVDPGLLRRRPILARADGEVYAGNYRLRAAIDLGRTWRVASFGSDGVPAFLDDITAEEARARAIRDNTSGGEWHEEQLAELLYGLRDAAVDVTALGMEGPDVERLLASVAGGPAGEPPTALARALGLLRQYVVTDVERARLRGLLTEAVDELDDPGYAVYCREAEAIRPGSADIVPRTAPDSA